ncbi:MAG TPA: alpha/beta hydrolase [Edaphobacter sp.]
MMRRKFLRNAAGVMGSTLLSEVALGLGSGAIIHEGSHKLGHLPHNASTPIDASEFHRIRRYATLPGFPGTKIAYVERGSGQVALFLHGYPLNGFQWRGAMERLSPYRRCIAPDFMGMGYTQAAATQDLSPISQADMLAALLDHLHVDKVDLIANDSGGEMAQVFLARHMDRVRTLLLTNCDVDENNPPDLFKPMIEAARKGQLADAFLLPQLRDKSIARSPNGMGVAFTHPEALADETVDCYLSPLASTPLRKEQFNRYTVGVGVNELVALRERLTQFHGPARMVWGTGDPLFPAKWAQWLDRTLPGSRGVRTVEGANLFFPEEMPELIAEEAVRLWGATPAPGMLL